MMWSNMWKSFTDLDTILFTEQPVECEFKIRTLAGDDQFKGTVQVGQLAGGKHTGLHSGDDLSIVDDAHPEVAAVDPEASHVHLEIRIKDEIRLEHAIHAGELIRLEGDAVAEQAGGFFSRSVHPCPA